MWSERRLFPFATVDGGSSDDAHHATSAPSSEHRSTSMLPHGAADFISRFEYVSLPHADEAQWRASACWYSPRDAADDDGGGAGTEDEDDEQWRMRTPPTIEYFLVGWSDGSVERHVIAPSHLRVVPEKLPPRQLLYRHEGQVTALCTLGTLVGSVGASMEGAKVAAATTTTCCIASSSPITGGLPTSPVALPHGPRSCPRSLLLWEGKDAWAADPTEGCVVYAFTGDDEGRVRLWRVDLAEASVTLLSVLGCIVFGAIVDVAKANVDSGRGVPSGSFLSSVHVHALCLDGEARLVAGTSDKKIMVWDLGSLDRHRPVVEDWHNVVGVADSKLIQQFVWIADPRATHPSLPTTTSSAKETKLLKALADGCYVGQVVNLQRQPVVAQQQHAPTAYSVLFPQRSKPIHVTAAALQVVQAPVLSFLGDAHGPVTSIAMLHDGFLVSGGADGRLRVWCWSETEGRYEGIRVVDAAHDDLITRVGVITMPVTFFTSSLDGVVKTWRIRSGLDVSLESAVGVRVASSLAAIEEEYSVTADPSAGHQPLEPYPGVGWACVYPHFGALFALLHMQSAVRSYTYDDVDGCALPPGWLFNGVRSVPTPHRSAGRASETGGDGGPLRWKGQSLSSEVLSAMATAELGGSDDDDG